MKRTIALCLLAVLLCFAPGCTSNKQEDNQGPKQVADYQNNNETPIKGGTLRLAMTGAKTFNPILAENNNNLYVFKLLYDSLFQRTSNDVLEPVLCEHYSISSDGLTYEFIIKDNVSFHNGAKLTAKDAEATLSAILGSETSLYRSRLSAVSAVRSEGMKLTITLVYPVVNFPALLDFPVLSEQDLASGINSLTLAPNGCGRYKVQSYKKSKELYLTVNENYHRDFSPNIENITVYLLKDVETAVTMLENMQIDVLTSDVMNLYAYTPKRNLSSKKFTGSQFTFIGINNQKPALLSAKTRSALNEAVHKTQIVSANALTYAAAAELPIPVGSFWNNNQSLPAVKETQQVKTMLAEDGWCDADGNGILEKDVYGELTELKPEILVNDDNQLRLKIAEQVKNAWNAIGVPANVTAVSFAEYQSRIASGAYDVFVGGVSLLPNYDLSFLLKTDSNVCGISQEKIDQILMTLTLADQDLQMQTLFHELCDVIRGEMPFISLYFDNDVLVFDSRLRGAIEPSASDAYYGIEHWFLTA